MYYIPDAFISACVFTIVLYLVCLPFALEKKMHFTRLTLYSVIMGGIFYLLTWVPPTTNVIFVLCYLAVLGYIAHSYVKLKKLPSILIPVVMFIVYLIMADSIS